MFTVYLCQLLGCAREGNPYGRIHDDQLQVARKVFSPRNGVGPKVTLLSAVHIGEKSFYEELQSHLNKADLVLFEGIGLKSEGEEIKKNCPQFKAKGGGHAETAKLLKLECQTDHIKKTTNFVHADMSLTELLDYRKIEPGKPLCERLKTQGTGLKHKPPLGGANRLRNMVALDVIKDMSHEIEFAHAGLLIHFERNKLVMKKLKEKIADYKRDQEIIIFYGAAHMPDMELSLHDMGYDLDTSDWLKAFSL